MASDGRIPTFRLCSVGLPSILYPALSNDLLPHLAALVSDAVDCEAIVDPTRQPTVRRLPRTNAVR